MAFYSQFQILKKELEEQGHQVLAPELEFETNEEDTSVGRFFEKNGGVYSFPAGHEVWVKKGNAISAHFRKIDESDCILVVNHEKKGIANYIGGNTFLEIGYAYGTGKPIYILNGMPEGSAYAEEIFGMRPIFLEGDISKLPL